MSKNSNKSAAPVKNVKAQAQKTQETAPVAVAPQAGADALRGRLESRTHAIHEVLLGAWREGRLCKMSDIVAGARALLGADHKSYEKLDKTAPSHINTMKGRQFIERVTINNVTAWRLTELGATNCGAGAFGADGAKTSKKARKTRTK